MNTVVMALRAQIVLAAEAIIAMREAECLNPAGPYQWNTNADRYCSDFADGALRLSQRYVSERP